MLNASFEDYATSCEPNAGEGRADIFLRSKHSFEFAYIFELKYLKGRREQSRLEDASKKALNQILERKYYKEAKRLGYRNIYIYGMAFSGKNAFVTGQKIEP